MSDTNQYPNTSAARKLLPTCAGFVVQKFDPDPKYRTEQSLTNEAGIEFAVSGIDKHVEVDVELLAVDLASTTSVQALTTLTFANVATLFPSIASFCGAGGSLTLAIKGGVKPVGNAGEVMKLAFKGFVNTVYPPQA